MVILKESRLEGGVLEGDIISPKQSVYDESEIQNYAISTKLVYGDGRIFRYSRNGGTALVKAYMTQSQVVETRTHEIIQSDGAFAVDQTQIAMTITGGGTFVRDEFAQGWFMINQGPGIGDIYKVLASHISFEAGGVVGGGKDDTIMNLLLATKIRTLTTTASEASLIPNRWWDVIVHPTTLTGLANGVPLIDIDPSYFFWAQTGGECPVYVDTSETGGEAPVIGNDFGQPTKTSHDVPGAGGNRVTLLQSWGNVRMVGNAAEPALIYLTLDK